MRLYVAGPMRGYPRFNFDAFEDATLTLRNLGHEVVSPAEMDIKLGFDPNGTLEDQGFDIEKAMERDLDVIVNKVDGIALLPGWEKSTGARTERFVAETVGRSVWHFVPGGGLHATPLRPAGPWDGNPTPQPDAPALTEREEAMLRHPSSQSEPGLPEFLRGQTPGVQSGYAAAIADEHEAFMERYRANLDAVRRAAAGTESFYVQNEAGIPPLPPLIRWDQFDGDVSDAQVELNRTYGLSDDGKTVVDPETHADFVRAQGVVTKPEPAAAEADTTNPKDLLGVKKPQLHLVPRSFIIRVAQAMTDGARKYGPYNWREKKVRATVYQSAAERHLAQWFDGEDNASDSGYHHLAHAAACIAILIDAIETGNLVDDRPPAGAAARLIAELTEG